MEKHGTDKIRLAVVTRCPACGKLISETHGATVRVNETLNRIFLTCENCGKESGYKIPA